LALFGAGTSGFILPTVQYTFMRLSPLIIVSLIGATPLPKRVLERLQERHSKWQTASILFCIGLFLVCVAYLVNSTFSPFEYTQF
jgi:alginate O-acetyltransferase complex protein AlgI